jgi:hypothetical protein
MARLARSRTSRTGVPSGDSAVIDWLLEPSQPSIRYLTQTQLLGQRPTDPEVVGSKGRLLETGWVPELLSEAAPGGFRLDAERFYEPKYLSPNWKLLVLSDLGVTRDEPRIAAACGSWIARFARDDGGFAPEGMRAGHLCTTGNMARALIRFGYEEHPAVRRAMEWLVANQAKLGGWSCFGSGRNLDSWEGMSAFAAYPRHRWTTEMASAVERGAEFFLERELHRQGDPYAPWFRFHAPVHYYYDLLVGLDFLTELGYTQDPRMAFALRHLRDRRRPDGRWALDSAQPDVEGSRARWFEQHPKRRPVPLELEPVGQPSKLVTFRAFRVLRRVSAGATGPPGDRLRAARP